MSKADKYDACDHTILKHCIPTSLNLCSSFMKYIVGLFAMYSVNKHYKRYHQPSHGEKHYQQIPKYFAIQHKITSIG